MAAQDARSIRLSILIPTYNRAGFLRTTLGLLLRFLGEEPRVEVVVSDNASADGTRGLVREYQQRFPGVVRYSRNESNVGSVNNVLTCVESLARGEFCWVIGDDDVILPGALQRILEVLDADPDLDYIFAGLGWLHPRAFAKIDPFHVSTEELLGKVIRRGSPPCAGRTLAWERLIDPAVNDVYLAALMVSIFRRKLWKDFTGSLRISARDSLTFGSYLGTYIHAHVFSHTLVGHRAHCMPTPNVAAVGWEREWYRSRLSGIIAVRLQQMLDDYAAQGVPRWRVAKCRRHLLSYSGIHLWRMLLDRSASLRGEFSLSSFIRRNGGYAEFWLAFFGVFSLYKAVSAALPGGVKAALRRLWGVK